MISLDKDLQKAKNNINEFGNVALRVLKYLPNVLSSSEEKNEYIIYSCQIAGTTKHVRPINKGLFYSDPDVFQMNFIRLKEIFNKIKNGTDISLDEKRIIDKTIYSIQQSIGAGLDLLVAPNSARKHVGNRFEELIRIVFSEIGISNKKVILQIPYETDEGVKTYKCENDLVI